MSLAIEEPTPLEQLDRHTWGQPETPLGSLPWGEPPALGAWRKLAAKVSFPLTAGPSTCDLARGHAKGLGGTGAIVSWLATGIALPSQPIQFTRFDWVEAQKSMLRNATATAIFNSAVEPMTGLVVVPHHRESGAATAVGDALAVIAEPEPHSNAYRAFKELAAWLLLDDGDLSVVIGVGRTTPYTWERERREPRAETARRLFQMHGTVAALVDQLGEPAATRWLAAGSPSPASLLRRGEIAEVNRLAHDLLFRPAARRAAPGGFAAEEEADVPPAALARAARGGLRSE
jgi:DNA-binding XRE family transcriptional regulator